MALQELTIRNFAIIKQLDIEVDEGLTVVTGETGAGKSIVLSALDLLLGSRADADMIRHDEDQAEITALFNIKGLSSVQEWLKRRNLLSANDSDNHNDQYCLIRRVVRRYKPTRCFINDQPTTLASLKELGLLLVDLHGQHEHQSLIRRSTQREILDQFADHKNELDAIATLSVKIHRIEKELSEQTQNRSANADRLALLSFQLNELDEANIAEDEFDELEQEHSRLANAQELINGIQLALDGLFQNESSNVSAELGKQINKLSELSEYDTNLIAANDLLNSSLAQIDDARNSIESALAKIEQDPERLHEVAQRRDTLINLARKHRCRETELVDRHTSLKTEFERLKNHSSKPEKLQIELSQFTAEYQELASVISSNRQKVAKKLSVAITEQMQGLGMKGGYLQIDVKARIEDNMVVSEHGFDTIEYRVSSNYGVPPKSLQRTASGGELSRISLAIQAIASEKSDTPTLVFDEVDVGVGGKIASVVGKRLRALGKNAQVICITHQPQVASQGHQHLFVDKVQRDNETYSTLIELRDEMRTSEIARMLGGDEITERTRAHAEEMLLSNESAGK